MYIDIDDNEIIKRVQSGDYKAYSHLIQKYKGPVFNLAFRMTGSYEDADDLAQDTFIRAFESLNHFNTRKKFFPWLYTICLNLIRNHLKKKKRFLFSSFNIENEKTLFHNKISTPEQILIKKQESEQITRLLQKIPIQMREAIILRYFQELDFVSISRITGISLSTAKMRVYRGLKKLKKLIDEENANKR